MATEPDVELPPPGVAVRADHLRRRVDVTTLGSELAALPAPRSPLAQPGDSAEAVALIEMTLRRAGWATRREDFRVRQTARRHYGRLLARYFPDAAGVNVVAEKRGLRHPDELVVIAAHHDTLARTPGADDNGAGLVALFGLARLLTETCLARTVALVAFDHEEIGFHGARHFVRQLPASVTVLGALVYETMAYVSHERGSQRLPSGFGALFPRQVRRVRQRGHVGDFDAVIYRRDAHLLARRIAGALAALEGSETAMLLRDPVDLPVLGPALKLLAPPARNLARSDHVAFWDAGLPAVQITDTANFRNPHYHQSSDTPDTVDLDRLAAIVAATAVAVEQTAGVVRRDDG